MHNLESSQVSRIGREARAISQSQMQRENQLIFTFPSNEMILLFLVEVCSASFSELNGDICSEPLLTLSHAGYLPQ